MARTESNEYFLWGNNKENQCLVYVEEDRYAYHRDVDFVKVPTKYEHAESLQILGMYLGFKDTKIVSIQTAKNKVLGNRKGAVREDMARKKRSGRKRNAVEIENLQRRIKQLKVWCSKLTPSNRSNSIPPTDRVEDWSSDRSAVCADHAEEEEEQKERSGARLSCLWLPMVSLPWEVE